MQPGNNTLLSLLNQPVTIGLKGDRGETLSMERPLAASWTWYKRSEAPLGPPVGDLSTLSWPSDKGDLMVKLDLPQYKDEKFQSTSYAILTIFAALPEATSECSIYIAQMHCLTEFRGAKVHLRDSSPTIAALMFDLVMITARHFRANRVFWELQTSLPENPILYYRRMGAVACGEDMMEINPFTSPSPLVCDIPASRNHDQSAANPFNHAELESLHYKDLDLHCRSYTVPGLPVEKHYLAIDLVPLHQPTKSSFFYCRVRLEVFRHNNRKSALIDQVSYIDRSDPTKG